MKRTEAGLKGARLARHLTQEVLGERSGVLQVTISKLEKNGPSRGVVNAIKLARALGMSVEDVFGKYAPKPSDTAQASPIVHNQQRERTGVKRAATG